MEPFPIEFKGTINIEASNPLEAVNKMCAIFKTLSKETKDDINLTYVRYAGAHGKVEVSVE